MTAPDAAAPPDFTARPATPDFTKRRDPIEFVIAPDTFRAPPILGGFQIKAVATMYAGLDLANLGEVEGAQRAVELVAELMKLLMPGEHGRRFAARMLSDGNPGDPEADPPVPPSPEPIDLMAEALPAFMYLLERHGLRPTAPSSASPAGSTEDVTAAPNDGTSSMGGASPTA